MISVSTILNNAAVVITNAVGTVWCALVFTALACVSLPDTLATGNPIQIVGWIAQTFLQLVLLSIVMVGQNNQSARMEELVERILANTESSIAELQADHKEDMENMTRIILSLTDHAIVVE